MCSEELGDIVRLDMMLALSIYQWMRAMRRPQGLGG
jgi:hypothetical protein